MKMNNNLKLAYGSGLLGLIAVLVIPGPRSEPLVGLAAESIPKTVMISVIADVVQRELVINKKGEFEVKETTVTAQLLGSGVFISPNGHVLTCAHLFNHGVVRSVTVKTYGEWEYPTEILYTDNVRDLALVKINDITPRYARLADPRKLRVGQEVIAVGNPLGLEFSVTHGILSALNRDLSDMRNVTQSDAFINPGNSGGPLFNMDGELVGINSFMIPPVDAAIFTGCGFSVNPGQIIEFLVRFTGIPKFNSTTYWRK